MTVYKEINLCDFEFWSGARDITQYLTDEDFEVIESILLDLYPNGISETELNDFFWFEPDTIADWLGYNNFEELEEDRE